MAAATQPLTNASIKAAKPTEKLYKLSDGGGLYLAISPNGGKSWRLKYRFNNKEKTYSIGKYPAISLQDARKKREEAKTLLANGIDPSQQKQEIKQQKKKEDEKKEHTFKKLALHRLEKIQESISESHYKRMLRGFQNDCFPYIGDKHIDEVTADDIIEILQKMEQRGVHNSAKKVHQAISKTYKWAVSNRYAKRNPANDIDINEVLGKKEVKHYATITKDEEIKKLLLTIDNYSGEISTRLALRLMSYTVVRTSNILQAEWSEIDFKAKQWNIPAHKMKTKREHIVPLTDSAITVVKEMQKITGTHRYIFSSTKNKSTHISDGAMRGALRRLGYTKEQFTPHGFRAMFSSITHEKSPFHHEAIEIHLAHSVGSGVSKAYNRAKYLNERRELMQWWSDYLDEVKKDG